MCADAPLRPRGLGRLRPRAFVALFALVRAALVVGALTGGAPGVAAACGRLCLHALLPILWQVRIVAPVCFAVAWPARPGWHAQFCACYILSVALLSFSFRRHAGIVRAYVLAWACRLCPFAAGVLSGSLRLHGLGGLGPWAAVARGTAPLLPACVGCRRHAAVAPGTTLRLPCSLWPSLQPV